MAITRVSLETVLVRRCGGWMQAVSESLSRRGVPALAPDYTTTDGTNAYLSDPIGDAMLSLGYTPEDLATPTDVDLSAIPTSLNGRLLLLAERRLINSLIGSWREVDASENGDSQSLGSLREDMLARVEAIEREIKAPVADANASRRQAPAVGPLKAGTGDAAAPAWDQDAIPTYYEPWQRRRG